jgi:hypothetical protein
MDAAAKSGPSLFLGQARAAGVLRMQKELLAAYEQASRAQLARMTQ